MLSNKRILYFVKNHYYRILFVLAITAFLETLLLMYLYAEPLHILYISIVSLLFAVLIVQIFYETGLSLIELNINTAILVLIVTYIFLSIWYGVIKAYPDYKKIIDFRQKRKDLIYNIQKNAPPPESHMAYKRQLAELYLYADPAVNKLEPHVNHSGVSLMRVFLEEQIKNGNGSKYGKYMYDLAETAFTVASRDLAKEWYEKARKYGIANAMERYQKRMDEFNKESNR